MSIDEGAPNNYIINFLFKKNRNGGETRRHVRSFAQHHERENLHLLVVLADYPGRGDRHRFPRADFDDCNVTGTHLDHPLPTRSR